MQMLLRTSNKCKDSQAGTGKPERTDNQQVCNRDPAHAITQIHRQFEGENDYDQSECQKREPVATEYRGRERIEAGPAHRAF